MDLFQIDTGMGWDTREEFLPVRVVRCCTGIPRGAVAAPSLAVPQAGLDGAQTAGGTVEGVSAHGRG